VNLLDRLRGRPPESSSATAKQRLKIVLEYDRAYLAPGALDQIRQDIIEAISKHVQIDPDDVNVTLEEGTQIVAHIPLQTTRSLTPAGPAAAGAAKG
jgi:cell division topological specificity factor